MKIFVKTHKKSTITIEVARCDTMDKVKAKIALETGIRCEHQKLCLAGLDVKHNRNNVQVLRSGRTLTDYDIGDNTTIHQIAPTLHWAWAEARQHLYNAKQYPPREESKPTPLHRVEVWRGSVAAFRPSTIRL